jgi:RNA 2',3'-cyclic 3'-phosphodiesterase
MSGRRVRLFVALDLPEEVRAHLLEWRRGPLTVRDGLRPVPAAALHLTLVFIGGRPESEVGQLSELVRACAAPVKDLVLGGALWLPPRRPRVLAVEVRDGIHALAGLQERVATVLEAEAGVAREERPFRPHVTVARVRSGQKVAPLELSAPRPLAFDGAALTLYRSKTAPTGAVYEALSRVELDGVS